MPKGDPVSLAEVSAVLGVKKTSELIPLCHPLPIDHTATKIVMNEVDNSLEVFCVVSAFAKTGVEMEALCGVSNGLLCAWDMIKSLEKNSEGQYPETKIHNIRVLEKRKAEPQD